MKTVVLAIIRARRIPKDEWRQPYCHRTLDPIDPTNLWPPPDLERGYAVRELEPAREPYFQTLIGKIRAHIGPLAIAFAEPADTTVTLIEERCLSQLGVPTRPTYQVAILRPWQPIRVILNGRQSSYSGQYYNLADYHLVLAAGPRPNTISEPREIDLEADLL